MKSDQIILTIGGGGFTHGTDPELDDICLRFSPSKPNIGYIGWANDDDETRISKFYARFEPLVGYLSHLPVGSSGEQTRAWLAGKDMVYFAGGNSARLIAAISANRSLSAFVSANKAGCVLAGVSAGGACWFDWILSDFSGSVFEPLEGLSLVAGGLCPHYSSEPARKPRFEEVIRNRANDTAFAVDDGACLVSVAGRVDSYFSARVDRAAYRLIRIGQNVTRTPVKHLVD